MDILNAFAFTYIKKWPKTFIDHSLNQNVTIRYTTMRNQIEVNWTNIIKKVSTNKYALFLHQK